jgi:MFS family permease
MAFSWADTFFFGFLIIGIVAFAGLLFWYSIKKGEQERHEKEGINPLFKSLALTMALALIIFGILFFQGKQINLFWIIVLIFTFCLVYYNEWKAMKKLNPVDAEILIDRGIELIKGRFNCDLAKGFFYGKAFRFFSVTESKKGGNLLDSVANIVFATNVGMMLIKLNVYTKYMVCLHPDPSKREVEKIFGQETARQYDVERLFLNEALGKNKDEEENRPQE